MPLGSTTLPQSRAEKKEQPARLIGNSCTKTPGMPFAVQFSVVSDR